MANLGYLCDMAKAIVSNFKRKGKVSRPGVHAKTKSSSCKTSKMYKKPNRGQGR